jgi:hypothetical protein
MECSVDEACEIQTIWQKAQRPKGPYCFLDETVQCVTQFVYSRSTELLLNVDNSIICQSERRRSRITIVAWWMSGETIHYNIQRDPKHLPVIVAV